VEILTPRLKLRRARLEDAEPLFEVFSDPAAMRFWSSPPHQGIEDTRRFVQAMIDSTDEESDDFVIELEGRPVGKTGCWRLPEVGYILHPGLWGLGLAQEALEAAIKHVFAHYDIPALTADVDPRNTRSIALLERLGFRETHRAERTWCVGGEWADSVYFELPRPDA
jgi:RimJ/RimL family protein N-acetyltransferase